MQDYEKLGVFYLGRGCSENGQTSEQPFLLDSRQLVTHGVIMGMTGSGKTGLGIALLEEAAIDSIPAVIVDPKGDLSNLLLTFPNLAASDFEPWVAPSQAQSRGISVAQLAAETAENWRKGLESWDQTAQRLELLRQTCDIEVYTPGSNAGQAISVLDSFAPPAPEVLQDCELLADRVQTAASGLLSFAGINTDTLQSREHLLISHLLMNAWQSGQTLSLAAMIGQVNQPPFSKIGVMDLDTFYPAKERMTLAMRLNSLVASPSFQAWCQGEALDPQKLMYTAAGKPRLAIISLAHLSDAERMFFVTLLADAMVNWMRAQSGTTSLRALFYMDEVCGYLPPVANPPSKRPFMTLLKQARAFGLGLILATQNPGDLDYKALANCGTWFVGRMQTERDREKVLQGLSQTAAASGNEHLRAALEALSARRFAVVSNGTCQVMETRWCLSYLRGPMTRDDIRKVRAMTSSAAVGAAVAVAPNQTVSSDNLPSRGVRAAGEAFSAEPPVLANDIDQYYLPSAEPAHHYSPVLMAAAKLNFNSLKLHVNEVRPFLVYTEISSGPVTVDWDNAQQLDIDFTKILPAPPSAALYDNVDGCLSNAKNYPGWCKAFADWLVREQQLTLFSYPALKLISQVGESAQDFRIRVRMALREERDKKKDQLTAKFAPKIKACEQKIAKAENKLEKEQQESSQASSSGLLNAGLSIVGLLFSKRRNVMKAGGSVLNSYNNAKNQKLQASQAEKEVDLQRQALEELQEELASALQDINSQFADDEIVVEELPVLLKKKDIAIALFGLLWLPCSKSSEVLPIA